MNTITLYHGTSWENIEDILCEGLKGGDNSKGGTHNRWKEPTLFLAKRKYVAEKYGAVIVVTIPEDKLEGRWINDGLGDECFIIEGSPDNFDEILVDADYLSCPAYNHEMGMCDENCKWCEEENE